MASDGEKWSNYVHNHISDTQNKTYRVWKQHHFVPVPWYSFSCRRWTPPPPYTEENYFATLALNY